MKQTQLFPLDFHSQKRPGSLWQTPGIELPSMADHKLGILFRLSPFGSIFTSIRLLVQLQ